MYMPYYATNSVGSIVDDYEGALNTATFSVLVGP
jgi:type III secretory pathway component EscT